MLTENMIKLKKDNKTQPFLKWAGGKRQLIDALKNNTPKNFSRYFEPFVGGGALLFEMQPVEAVINDFNSDLINAFNVIKNDVEGLINSLKKHKNTPEYFYNIRKRDREEGFEKMSNLEKASRLIYLNKTCYN